MTSSARRIFFLAFTAAGEDCPRASMIWARCFALGSQVFRALYTLSLATRWALWSYSWEVSPLLRLTDAALPSHDTLTLMRGLE